MENCSAWFAQNYMISESQQIIAARQLLRAYLFQSHKVSTKSHWVTKCWIFFLQNSIAGTACCTWGFYWKEQVPTSKYSRYKHLQRCGREDFLFKRKLHILTCWHMMGLWINFYQELFMWLLHFILLVTSCFFTIGHLVGLFQLNFAWYHTVFYWISLKYRKPHNPDLTLT